MVKTKYAPTVEARRDDYTRLAESIIFMLELDMNREGSRLDVPCDAVHGQATGAHSEHSCAVLMDALADHLTATFTAPDLLNPATIRMFYVELRLLADQQDLDQRTKATRSLPFARP